jgi:NAD(P)-dependent dehydrogenase (short-subunit alcohol dehydrogenase family)
MHLLQHGRKRATHHRGVPAIRSIWGRSAATSGSQPNIASTEGLGATPYLSPYTVSKHGVVGLTRSLACELGPQGVT